MLIPRTYSHLSFNPLTTPLTTSLTTPVNSCNMLGNPLWAGFGFSVHVSKNLPPHLASFSLLLSQPCPHHHLGLFPSPTTTTRRMELAQGVFLSQDLYNALKQNDDVVWKNVDVLSDEQNTRLFDIGITTREPIATLKDHINKAQDEKKFCVTRCKEFSTEIDVNALEGSIAGIVDMFKVVVAQESFSTIEAAIRGAFMLKSEEEHGTNSDWDIYLVSKQGDRVVVCVFRIEALMINNQWNFYFFKWGKNAVKVDFLGYHLLPQK